MSGLVKKLELQADHVDQLEGAIKILMKWTSRIYGYSVDRDENGELLRFHWTKGDSVRNVTPFLNHIKDPAELAMIAVNWLADRDWPEVKGQCGGDGDDCRGFEITNRTDRSDYSVFCVIRPRWIYYSK